MSDFEPHEPEEPAWYVALARFGKNSEDVFDECRKRHFQELFNNNVEYEKYLKQKNYDIVCDALCDIPNVVSLLVSTTISHRAERLKDFDQIILHHYLLFPGRLHSSYYLIVHLS